MKMGKTSRNRRGGATLPRSDKSGTNGTSDVQEAASRQSPGGSRHARSLLQPRSLSLL